MGEYLVGQPPATMLQTQKAVEEPSGELRAMRRARDDPKSSWKREPRPQGLLFDSI